MDLILLATTLEVAATLTRYLPCTQPNTSQCKLTRLAGLASLGPPKLTKPK